MTPSKAALITGVPDPDIITVSTGFHAPEPSPVVDVDAPKATDGLGPILEAVGVSLGVVHRATVRMVLTDLLPVINQIHGGCEQCRKHWMNRANAVLEADGVPWRYAPKTDSLGHEVKGVDGQPAELVLVAV